MATDRNLVFGGGALGAGVHAHGPSRSLKHEHGLGGACVECAMQPANEIQRGGFREFAGRVPPVDFALDPDVRPRFQLQVAPILDRVELVGECVFDLARRGVVAFDAVGVVAVHDPHQVGQAGGSLGMQPRAQTAAAVARMAMRSTISGLVCSSRQGSIREGVSGRLVIADLCKPHLFD